MEMKSSTTSEGGFSLQSDHVLDNVWQHAACVVWDGKRVMIYIDGKLNADKEYMGEYYPANNANPCENLNLAAPIWALVQFHTRLAN